MCAFRKILPETSKIYVTKNCDNVQTQIMFGYLEYGICSDNTEA